MTYLELKQMISDFLISDNVVDENSNIIIQYENIMPKPVVLDNEELIAAYRKINGEGKEYNLDGIEIYSKNIREVAIDNHFGLIRDENFQIEDENNNIKYSIGYPSLEYILYILSIVFEKNNKERFLFLTRRSLHRIFIRGIDEKKANNWSYLLGNVLRLQTIRVESTENFSKKKLKDLSYAMQFLWMYKLSKPIAEYSNISDIFPSLATDRHFISREEIEMPPARIYNSQVMDYYTMAMESADPFTRYIAFYHIVEYYFDTVFRKKLTEKIKDKLTGPDFSYKNEDSLYKLAKYIKNQMKDDDENGRGNEFESLKYVLKEYVSVDELKSRISFFDNISIEYYRRNKVKFTTKSTAIEWSDPIGVYANLANRIYATRNALVHGKSENSEDTYRPYQHRKELLKELPLIRAVAELVMINSSKVI